MPSDASSCDTDSRLRITADAVGRFVVGHGSSTPDRFMCHLRVRVDAASHAETDTETDAPSLGPTSQLMECDADLRLHITTDAVGRFVVGHGSLTSDRFVCHLRVLADGTADGHASSQPR